MAKPIGLSRALKLEWLNKAAELAREKQSESDIKDALNLYLSFFIESPIVLRKTRELLMNLWVYSDIFDPNIRQRALELFDSQSSESLLLHWCMLILGFPVFKDVCGLIGKLAEIQDTFTASWLKKTMAEGWGERTTLLHAIDKMLQTLRSIDAIKRVGNGVYRIKQRKINNPELVDVAVRTILALDMKPYYELLDLAHCPHMFPFHFEVTHQMIHEAEGYALQSYNGNIVISLIQ